MQYDSYPSSPYAMYLSVAFLMRNFRDASTLTYTISAAGIIDKLAVVTEKE